MRRSFHERIAVAVTWISVVILLVYLAWPLVR